jgi:hypothetical protein
MYTDVRGDFLLLLSDVRCRLRLHAAATVLLLRLCRCGRCEVMKECVSELSTALCVQTSFKDMLSSLATVTF